MQPVTPIQHHSLRMTEGYIISVLSEAFSKMLTILELDPQTKISAPNVYHGDCVIEEYADPETHFTFPEREPFDIRVSRKLTPSEGVIQRSEILHWFPQPRVQRVQNVLDAPYCTLCNSIKPHIDMRNADTCKQCSHRACNSFKHEATLTR